jgi:hypothetical protein
MQSGGAVMEEQSNLIKELSRPIFEAKGWMRLLGVVMIVQGILTAFTIVGIIIAWLPIWLGVLIFQSASSAESAQMSGDKLHLVTSLNKLKTYFVINGVLMLVVLAFLVFSIFIAGAGMFSMMNSFG